MKGLLTQSERKPTTSKEETKCWGQHEPLSYPNRLYKTKSNQHGKYPENKVAESRHLLKSSRSVVEAFKDR